MIVTTTPVDEWVQDANTLPLECPNDASHAFVSSHSKEEDRLVCLECDWELVLEPGVVLYYTSSEPI